MLFFALMLAAMGTLNALPRATVAAGPHIDPAHATNITVYHVNPRSSGAIPVNMDTGNGAGDLFFDLFEVLMYPLACSNPEHAGHSCTNPEASGDLVVNKLVLEVRSCRYAGDDSAS
jgi:hypothetical protein